MRELPDQVAVTSRLCISFVITSVITLGSFPNVIPQSQTVTIGTLASAFTMVFPTLLFSIGAGKSAYEIPVKAHVLILFIIS